MVHFTTEGSDLIVIELTSKWFGGWMSQVWISQQKAFGKNPIPRANAHYCPCRVGSVGITAMVINSPACGPEPNGYIWSISLNLVPIQCPILLAFLMWKKKSKCCRVLAILKEKKELGPVEQMDKYRIKSFFS